MPQEIGSRSKICPFRDKLPAQNFEAVLAVMGNLAGIPDLQSFARMHTSIF